MQACSITVFSTTDGEEKQFTADGEWLISSDKTEIRYTDGSSQVGLTVSDGCADLSRTGEYTLFLPLRAGERSVGLIGIGGSSGKVEISTKKISFTKRSDEAVFCAEYALHFGQEIQRMKIRVKARRKDL